MRNSITAQEAAFVDTELYQTCSGAACEGSLPGFKASRNGSGNPALDTFEHTGDADGFTAEGSHLQGNLLYDYDSATGVLDSNPKP